MKSCLLFCVALGAVPITARAAIQKDIEYGIADGVSLKLDASVPDGPGPFPTVILVHGGGWTAGDKSGGPQKGYMAPMQDPLSAAGFAWFSINYRLAPKYRFPACLEDVETAIRWVKAHADQYHLDPKRIALAGESAGGELIDLAAMRADDTTRVAAVVAFYGPTDIVATALDADGKLGASRAALTGRTEFDAQTKALLHDASPINFVKPGLPPFLLVHGTADKNVPYTQSIDLQAKLRAVGGSCDLITIKDGPHGMLPWPPLAPHFKEEVVAWLQRTLQIPLAKAAM
jgi:alpha-L-fucosidase 2